MKSIKDSEFIRGNIPMTKQEVRSLVLDNAQISSKDIIIDIGAGTGSLSIESALRAIDGKVYAIEKEEEGIELIKANMEKFKVPNIEPIQGFAPEAASHITNADVIFIGGSGGKLLDILNYSIRCLNPLGRLVITAITVETLYSALHFMQEQPDFTTEAFGVQITRIKSIRTSNMLQALNPIYIITCTKNKEAV